MAQAIRRKNIAAVQLRRKDRTVRRYIRATINGILGITALISVFVGPHLLSLYRPEVEAFLRVLKLGS